MKFYENVLQALKSFENFEDCTFVVDGVECFISRDIFPTNVFSAGVRGCSTAIYLKGSSSGCLNTAYAPMYDANSPTAEQVASAIAECNRRK